MSRVARTSQISFRWWAGMFAAALPLLAACTTPVSRTHVSREIAAPAPAAQAAAALSTPTNTKASFNAGNSAGPSTAPAKDAAHRGLSTPLHSSAAPGGVVQASADLPVEAETGYPGDGYTRPGPVPGYLWPPGADPLPLAAFGPWRPPGIACPWPPDEYICDGGDHDPRVFVRSDGSLKGLNLEDTVAEFETADGDHGIKPSNRVCIYSPRFAAVRKVDTVYQNNQFDKLGGVDQPMRLAKTKESLPPNTTMQTVEPVGEVGTRRPIGLIERQPAKINEAVLVPLALQDAIMPYENFQIIRAGRLDEAEKPMLAQKVQNAITWTSDQAVQVLIEGRRAQTLDGDQRAQATFGTAPGVPCLRICKVASTHSARVGETVDFTLRFDNTGTQKLRNVVIVDNLTTRLEYVPGSARSNLNARFSSEANQGGSLALRWELVDALAPGQGGIVRFQCKVR